MYIHYGAKNICMTHRPENADPNAAWNFCGHVHERYKVRRLNENSLIVNLCVEVWNYYPAYFDEICSTVAEFLRVEKEQGKEGESLL